MAGQENISTLQYILNMHRHWITKLYTEDMMTEMEIVQSLQGRNFSVTLPEIQRIIADWNLSRTSIRTDSPTLPPRTIPVEDWKLVPSVSASDFSSISSSTNTSYVPSDIDIMGQYNKRPLPALPKIKSKNQKRKAQSKDRLGLTCHHGGLPSESHEVQSTLGFIPQGTSPLERYTSSQETHERIALGLERYSFVPNHKRADGFGERRRFSPPRMRPQIQLAKDGDSVRVQRGGGERKDGSDQTKERGDNVAKEEEEVMKGREE